MAPRSPGPAEGGRKAQPSLDVRWFGPAVFTHITDRSTIATMAKIPPPVTADQPELVAAVIEARKIQMETEDTPFAIEWLMEHHPMSLNSATRVLEDATFQYAALYPEGHPGLESL